MSRFARDCWSATTAGAMASMAVSASMKMLRRCWPSALAVAVLLLTAVTGTAQTVIDWTGGGIGNAYLFPPNWNPGNVPNNVNETAQFNIPGTYDVDLPSTQDLTVSDLLVLDGTVTFEKLTIFPNNTHTYTVDDDADIRSDTTFRNVTAGELRIDVNDRLLVSGQPGTGEKRLTIDGVVVVEAERMDVGIASEDGRVVIEQGTLDVAGLTTIGNTSHSGTVEVFNGSGFSTTLTLIGRDPSSTGTATISGDGSTWTNSINMIVGEDGPGTVTVEAGGQVFNHNGALGASPDSTGTATVTGAGSTWTNSNITIVGDRGQGTLTVEAGGQFSDFLGFIGDDPGSIGTATVTGAGSTWTNSTSLYVGGSIVAPGGMGNLIVADQGLVDVADTLIVWGTGAVTINGGTIAMNTLDIEPGGTFNFNFGTLNFTSDLSITPGDSLQTALGGSHTMSYGKTLQVDGATTLDNVLTIDGGTFATSGLANAQLLQFNSGTLQMNGPLTVGATGLFGSTVTVLTEQDLSVRDTLTVDAGATLTMAGGTTGGETGAVVNNGLISGAGSIHGTMFNDSGGEIQVISGQNLSLTGIFNTNNGQITLAGGHVHFTDDLTNGATGLVIGNGTLRVDNGLTNNGDMALSATTNVIGDVTNNTGGTIISAGGTTTFFDDVTNNAEIRTNANSFSVYFGSYAGNGDTGTGTVIMEGDLKPGSSPGTMSFAGDLMFGPAAGLEIEIGGVTAGSEFDVVSVADEIALGGTLDIQLINGFLPSAGDSFEIVTAADVQGVFDNELFPTLTGGLQWSIEYQPTSVSLLVGLAGDFDSDGDVDGNDFLEWQRTDGTPGGLADWQTNYGNTAPLAAASAGVPEPTSMLLLLGTSLLMVCVRR